MSVEVINIVASALITVVTLITKSLVNDINEKFQRVEKRVNDADARILRYLERLEKSVATLELLISKQKKQSSEFDQKIMVANIKFANDINKRIALMAKKLQDHNDDFGRVILLEELAKKHSHRIDMIVKLLKDKK
ncbi:MAG: hypothetical protein KJO73_09120 [Croceitalea sp.]|nr:hypothetical protein [Croceitalea sp.]